MSHEAQPPDPRALPDTKARELPRRRWRIATRIVSCMTILLVDDPREPSRAVLPLWLGAFGARVVAADSGDQALRTLESVTPDVILCNLALKDMEAVTFAHRVQADHRRAGISLIAMSRMSHPEAVMAELRVAGFRDHLSQPFDFFDVVERLARSRPGSTGSPPQSRMDE